MLGLDRLQNLFSQRQSLPVEVEPEATPEVEATQEWITIGDQVTVLADDSGNEYEEGEYVGMVHTISVSPYYHEIEQGIIRVFVVGKTFASWVLPGDLKLYIQQQNETVVA
jgi:hypothetical protein